MSQRPIPGRQQSLARAGMLVELGPACLQHERPVPGSAHGIGFAVIDEVLDLRRLPRRLFRWLAPQRSDTGAIRVIFEFQALPEAFDAGIGHPAQGEGRMRQITDRPPPLLDLIEDDIHRLATGLFAGTEVVQGTRAAVEVKDVAFYRLAPSRKRGTVGVGLGRQNQHSRFQDDAHCFKSKFPGRAPCPV
jgi:hypothetical protein